MLSRGNLVFFALLCLFWLVVNLYLGRRVIAVWAPSPRGRRVVRSALAVETLLAPSAFLAMPFSGGAVADAVQRVGFLAIGFVSVVVVLFLGVDALALLDRGARWIRRRAAEPFPVAERRRFLLMLAQGAIGTAAAGITAVGYGRARRLAAIERVELSLPDLPEALDGFRVAQVSDLHVGPMVRRDEVAEIVAAVNALEADMVAITGDLVDGTVPRIGAYVAPLATLRSTHGTFFCTGNHEYYSGAERWCEAIAALGITVLNDTHRLVEHGDGRLLVAGVTDLHGARFVPSHRSDPAGARRGAPPHDLSLLLAHQPRSAFAASAAGYDVQISGHTHGGQYFPFTWLVHLVQPFSAGLDRLGAMWIYVNRGTTFWGPPVRFGAPQEITLLTLRRA